MKRDAALRCTTRGIAMLVFRSLLFAPGNHARRVEKSLTLDADMVILDLEDAVAIAEKPAAREKVVAAFQAPRPRLRPDQRLAYTPSSWVRSTRRSRPPTKRSRSPAAMSRRSRKRRRADRHPYRSTGTSSTIRSWRRPGARCGSPNRSASAAGAPGADDPAHVLPDTTMNGRGRHGAIVS